MVENRCTQVLTLDVSAATVVLRILVVARTCCVLVLLSGVMEWMDDHNWPYLSECALMAAFGYAAVRYTPWLASIVAVGTPWIACCVVWCGTPIILLAFAKEDLGLVPILVLAVGFWTLAYFVSRKIFWPLLLTTRDRRDVQIAHEILRREERGLRRALSYYGYLLRTGKPRASTGAFVAGLVTAVGLATFSISLGFWQGSVPLAVAIRYCWGKAWSSLVHPLKEFDIQLPSQFCLYLRSFSDDSLEVERSLGMPEWLTRGLIAWLFVGTIRFEEIVVRTLWRYWPVFGIATPNEQRPPAGAVRVPTQDWQADVLRLSSTAERIIAVAGFTSGLKWELEQAVQLPMIHKLILLFPPEPERLLRDRAFFPIRALMDTIRTEVEGLDQPIAVIFGERDEVVVLRAKRLTVSKYKTALKLACLPRSFIMGITVDRGPKNLVQ